jgi:hypothetical protein
MLGTIDVAAIRVFLIFLWTSAAALIAAVVFFRLHRRKAFAIAAYSDVIFVALTAWAYYSIWGYVWLR